MKSHRTNESTALVKKIKKLTDFHLEKRVQRRIVGNEGAAEAEGE